MSSLIHQGRATYAFFERNWNITKRYWAWELVWLVYLIVNALSVTYIGASAGAITGVTLRSEGRPDPQAQLEERLYVVVTRYVTDAFNRLRERPMAIYPLRTVLGCMIHFLISLAVVIVMIWCFRGFGNLSALAVLPVSLAILFVFGWAVSAVGGTANVRAANGGLDANWMVRHGVPTVTFGAGQNEAHTIDEWINLDEYDRACTLALQLATMR